MNKMMKETIEYVKELQKEIMCQPCTPFMVKHQNYFQHLIPYRYGTIIVLFHEETSRICGFLKSGTFFYDMDGLDRETREKLREENIISIAELFARYNADAKKLFNTWSDQVPDTPPRVGFAFTSKVLAKSEKLLKEGRTKAEPLFEEDDAYKVISKDDMYEIAAGKKSLKEAAEESFRENIETAPGMLAFLKAQNEAVNLVLAEEARKNEVSKDGPDPHIEHKCEEESAIINHHNEKVFILHGYWDTPDSDGAVIVKVTPSEKDAIEALGKIAKRKAADYLRIEGYLVEEKSERVYEVTNGEKYAKFYITEQAVDDEKPEKTSGCGTRCDCEK